jgi:NhaA family Na+:H+ antiporter
MCLHHGGLHPTLAGVVLAFCMPATGKGATISKQFEHALNKPVAFLVLPLFVLANTAIPLQNSQWPWPPFALAIVLALVPGKAIGIAGAAWISLKLKWTLLPEGTSLRTLAAGSLLGGIGFTLSIFFCDLSLSQATIQENAKLAVLAGSAIAALSGCMALVMATKRKN